MGVNPSLSIQHTEVPTTRPPVQKRKISSKIERLRTQLDIPVMPTTFPKTPLEKTESREVIDPGSLRRKRPLPRRGAPLSKFEIIKGTSQGNLAYQATQKKTSAVAKLAEASTETGQTLQSTRSNKTQKTIDNASSENPGWCSVM
ncbi:MAG: hypothetical protein VX777_06125 [Chlamydiota bacterium]|nr:hypothetical protein [Chlamydiota bacterium]